MVSPPGWQRGGACLRIKQNQGGQRTQLWPQPLKDASGMSSVGVKGMCSGGRQPGAAY